MADKGVDRRSPARRAVAKARTAKARQRRRPPTSTEAAEETVATASPVPPPGPDMEFRPFKALGFRPAAVVVGISSMGVVGPLAVSQLIQQLKMDQVCGLDSPWFPPISVVYFQKPKFPARIYASKRHRLVVVLAEFEPAPDVVRPLVLALLAWCQAAAARLLVAVEGLPSTDVDPALRLAAVGSTDRMRARIAALELPEMLHGAVAGVAGVLLNEGRWRDLDVLALTVPVGPDRHDHEGARDVLGGLKRLLPRLPLKVRLDGPEPTELEKAIRAARESTSTHEFI